MIGCSECDACGYSGATGIGLAGLSLCTRCTVELIVDMVCAAGLTESEIFNMFTRIDNDRRIRDLAGL